MIDDHESALSSYGYPDSQEKMQKAQRNDGAPENWKRRPTPPPPQAEPAPSKPPEHKIKNS